MTERKSELDSLNSKDNVKATKPEHVNILNTSRLDAYGTGMGHESITLQMSVHY